MRVAEVRADERQRAVLQRRREARVPDGVRGQAVRVVRAGVADVRERIDDAAELRGRDEARAVQRRAGDLRSDRGQRRGRGGRVGDEARLHRRVAREQRLADLERAGQRRAAIDLIRGLVLGERERAERGRAAHVRRRRERAGSGCVAGREPDGARVERGQHRRADQPRRPRGQRDAAAAARALDRRAHRRRALPRRVERRQVAVREPVRAVERQRARVGERRAADDDPRARIARRRGDVVRDRAVRLPAHVEPARERARAVPAADAGASGDRQPLVRMVAVGDRRAVVRRLLHERERPE